MTSTKQTATGQPITAQTVTAQRLGQTLILTLSRPAARNAMNAAMIGDLQAALDHAQADPEVRALVITGQGESFCAGLDIEELKAMSGRSGEQHLADAQAFAALLERLYLFPLPTFAAINGHAVGAGAALLCACDFAVQDERAKVGFTEVKIGFVAALVAVFLVRQLSEKHARDLLLSARLVGANEAAQMGLITQVAPANEALKLALTLAEGVSRNAPRSLRLTKQMLSQAQHLSLGDALGQAAALNAQGRSSQSLKEGVTAFLEKRAPDWDKVDER